MRTFLIALVCSVAAFIGGSAYMFYQIVTNLGPPLPSPGSVYYGWLSSAGTVVGSPDEPIRSDQSIRDALGIQFFSWTQLLTPVFDKLDRQQVDRVKHYLPYLRASVPAHYASAANVLVDCISSAQVGDDISECNVTVARAYLAENPSQAFFSPAK